MSSPHRAGDIYAPIEDTRVPLGLKILVMIMFLLLLGSIAAIVLSIWRLGLLSLP